MLPCVPCYLLASLAMSISLLVGVGVAAAAPSPELTFLREVLNIKRGEKRRDASQEAKLTIVPP